MGADIHFVIESRAKDQPWVGVYCTGSSPRFRPRSYMTGLNSREYLYDIDAPQRERNYAFFAKLAGVRGPGPKPKGMPKDASELARRSRENWGSDGHSHSYVSLDEFAAAWLATALPEVQAAVVAARLEREGFHPAAWLFDLYDNVGSEHRVVFWFDN